MTMTMTTMTESNFALLSALALASGCVADGSDRDVATVTLTALDVEHGERPLIDLGLPIEWIVDGTEEPIDLRLIDVDDGSMTIRQLDEYLLRAIDLDPAHVAALARSRFVVVPGVDDPVGQHTEALVGRCTYESSDKSGNAVCEWIDMICPSSNDCYGNRTP